MWGGVNENSWEVCESARVEETGKHGEKERKKEGREMYTQPMYQLTKERVSVRGGS